MAEAIQRGKIKKAPAKEVVEYLIRPGIQSDLSRSYQTILDVNKAHVLMLAKQGIISHEVAAQILRVTQDLASQQDDPQFEITPDVEDLYFNFERYLIQKTSLKVALSVKITFATLSVLHGVVKHAIFAGVYR